jgi:hypothetical protein
MNDKQKKDPKEGSYEDKNFKPDYSKDVELAYFNASQSAEQPKSDYNNQASLQRIRKMNRLLVKLCADYSAALQHALQMLNYCNADNSVSVDAVPLFTPKKNAN